MQIEAVQELHGAAEHLCVRALVYMVLVSG